MKFPRLTVLAALLLPALLSAQTAHQGLRELQLAEYPGVYTASIITQGNTSLASQVTIRCKDLLGANMGISGNAVRVRICNSGSYAASTNATIAAGTGSSALETLTSTKDLVLSNVAGVAASGTLTISSTVSDTETVTIAGRIYEFDWDPTSTITSGNVRVNISAAGTKASRVLTLDTQPTAGDTTTIGTRTYVWVPVGTADSPGEISVGASLPAAKVNFVAAVNGTDGFNTANSVCTAADFATDACTLTARVPGTAANSSPTTETFAAGTNVFAGSTFTGGALPSATSAGDALVAAWAADTAGTVTGSNSTGTVTVTAKSSGTGGNAITTTELMANASFGSGLLSGGVTADLSAFKVAVTDASAETVTLRVGPPPLSGYYGDYHATLNVTHAAP